jgi:chromate transporter
MTFVGYVGAYRASDELGIPGVVAGLLGFAIAAWATFLPSFGFVLIGAPSVERLRHDPRVAGALAAVTAAVVGVIADLALWFSLAVLFDDVERVTWGPVSVDIPAAGSLDGWAALLTGVSLVLLLRVKWGLLRVLLLAAAAGLVLSLVGLHP